MLLYLMFHSIKQALLVVGNIPFAMVGGIAALWIRGMNLNLSASVGFIALFGVGSWRNETAPVHCLSTLLIRDSYRQEVGCRAQPSFVIELPPVEYLVGIHVVSSCHSRYRGSRH